MKTESIPSGCVTSPRGFHAGATYAGIKKKSDSALDLAILFSEAPCVAVGVFTTNRIKAAPVILCQQRLPSAKIRAVVVNSGCANACTGEQGKADAVEMARLGAKGIGLDPETMLVASTGVIGVPLPMNLLRAGIGKVALSTDGGHEFARAIMTTDTRPKEIAIKVKAEKIEFIVGGVAKGAGMIHPDLATMLCFLAADAVVDVDFLGVALNKAVDASFNMISVDGDSSPNDTVLLMANGQAENKVITRGSELAEAFQQALEQVCVHLAKSIARDGEGATRLIELKVESAPGVAEARRVARTIISSPLVKAAVHGNDPNWGRIVAAAGRSGVEIIESKIDLYIGNICLLKAGRPQPFNKKAAVAVLDKKEVAVKLDLNLGTASATAWGCDLSEEYVTINSQYTT